MSLALPAVAQPSAPGAVPAASVPAAASDRISTIVSALTLPEKIDIIRGREEPKSTNLGEAGYLPGVPRLGIQPIRLADGPPGVLVSRPSIAEVATMGVAATFDVAVARANGELIADEARRLGIDVVLQPFINMDRDLAFHRSYNTFGEDPLLTGVMGAAEIAGIQSHGVMAQAKHFVAYESDGVDVHVDPQALREIYVEPFRYAVDAAVSSIMCSYNRLNGDWACGNHDALTGILRDELGFKGFVTSDWGAVHGNRQVPAGMDMEMPGVLPDTNPFAGILPSYSDIMPAPHHVPTPDFSQYTRVFVSSMPEEPVAEVPDWEKTFPVDRNFVNLSEALADGSVKPEDIDVAAGRVIAQLDRFGKVAGGSPSMVSPIMSFEQADAINLQTARKSAVLLKNQGGALPLSRSDLAGLAMIGPGAGQVVAVGFAGERSLGMPWRQTSPLDALRMAAGPEGSIAFAVADDMTGTAVPADRLSNDGAPGMVHVGDAAPATRVDTIDFTRSNGKALPGGGHHRWSGKLRVDKPGSYWLALQVLGARGSLYIDGKRLAGSTSYPGALHGDTVQANQDSLLPTTDHLDNVRIAVDLAAGDHAVVVEVEPDGSGDAEQVRFAWSTPEARKRDRDAAVAAARTAKKAVVFVWSRNDPVFALPGDQNALVEAVAAVNKNTIVVLNTSQPVAMPWLNSVKAVVQMWWSGDQGGRATADVLTGAVSPGGKLPFTWGRRLQDYPASDPAYPERTATGIGGRTTFSEGIYIGYRWFDRTGRKPLFSFGHGLSYSRFAFSDLTIRSADDGGRDISFTVSNIGPVEADEVAQVYLGAPSSINADGAFARKALAGFERITLAPGAARTVRIHLPRHVFEYWSAKANAWKLTVGDRRVLVGAASDDIRLTGSITSPVAR